MQKQTGHLSKHQTVHEPQADQLLLWVWTDAESSGEQLPHLVPLSRVTVILHIIFCHIALILIIENVFFIYFSMFCIQIPHG